MNYISGSGTAPTRSCCSQLASVVQSQPQCLCSALGGDSSSLGGVTINKTRALELPNACNVQAPPASKCNGADTWHLFCLQLVVAVLLVPVPTRRPPGSADTGRLGIEDDAVGVPARGRRLVASWPGGSGVALALPAVYAVSAV
uniref:Bifunctional inhibitor/plant lipid transfer protein/seed storage helical domain-containing protein n=1 Tax=Aegilops tauschii TaxID=37682 RepID=M8BQW0_AEGTA